jgi:hypothetical protein
MRETWVSAPPVENTASGSTLLKPSEAVHTLPMAVESKACGIKAPSAGHPAERTISGPSGRAPRVSARGERAIRPPIHQHTSLPPMMVTSSRSIRQNVLKAGQPVVPVAHPRLGIEVVAISSQDLMVETARLFGFDRTGPDLKEAIDRQTVTLVKSGRLHLDGNVLRLRADGAVP